MRRIQVSIAFGCCFLATAGLVQGQQRKAGLWELTTVTTFQQAPASMGAAGPATRTSQICLTQQMIDKYGSILPMTSAACHLTNIVRKEQSMKADLVCAGPMNGTGTIESSFTAENAKGTVHFAGAIQQGENSVPIEWTSNSTSVFKSPDCGDVKPMPMPEEKK
jgi:Protein of unknown function (DUF3617)